MERNLWSQAEFDSVTARKLCELRERFYPDTVQFPPEQMAVVLTDLYARGATIVSNEKATASTSAGRTPSILWS